MQNPVSTLSISSKNINSCKDVAKFLQKCGVTCSVSTNYSIIPKNGKCILEKGCDIILNDTNPENIGKKVWTPLKDSFNLDCAYLNIKGGFGGCVLDFLRPTECVGEKNL